MDESKTKRQPAIRNIKKERKKNAVKERVNIDT